MKIKSAFVINSIIISVLVLSGIIVSPVFYVAALPFGIVLPACSTKK